MLVPVLYELDANGEATGAVHPFCSGQHLEQFRDEHQSSRFHAGTDSTINWGFDPQCEQCSKEMR